MHETSNQPDARHQELIRAELRRVLGGRFFSGSPRLKEFLRYSVEHTLSGDIADLKEVCIGIHVFGKPPNYDPKSEPIVRVEARRLRARLDEHYQSATPAGRIRIRLPKGGYQAQFEWVEPEAPREETVVDAATAAEARPYQAVKPASIPQPEPPSRLPHSRVRRTLVIVAAVAALAFLAGVGTVLLPTLVRPRPLAFSRIVPLANYSGTDLQPAISHDGKQVAFSWGRETGENYDIYVKLLDVGTAIRLTTDPAQDLAPQWSPDDRYIAFERISADLQSVYIIPALGGAERKLTDIHFPSPWKPDALQAQMSSALAWAADGKSLIITDQDSGSHGGRALYQVALDGSSRRRLTSPGSLIFDIGAVVSHDGKQLAFVRETTNSSSDVFVARPDGSGLRQITFDRMHIRGVAWAPDDRSLLFASNRSGIDGLWQISLQGGQPMSLQAKGDEVLSPTLSSDGAVLAYTATTHNSNIWRAPLGVPGSRPQLLISSNGRNDSPRYSPDGTKIVFVSDRTGTWELWLSDSEGHNLRQITSFGGPLVGTPHWSPDSRFIVFDARPTGRSVIYVVGVDGSSPAKVIDDGFEDKKPSWSRDGRSLYYTSNRNGRSQLWRSDTQGHNAAQLTDITCNDNQESLDGKFVYFLGEGNGFFRIPAAGGKPHFIEPLSGVHPSRYFDLDERLYYLVHGTGPDQVAEYNPATGSSITVASIPGHVVYGTPSLSVSPDHRYLIYAQDDKLSSEIMTLRR